MARSRCSPPARPTTSRGATSCRAGVEQVNGVPVRRFTVKHERDPLVFGKRSDRVFEQRHSLGDELDWLDAEGPTSPALVDYIAKHAADYDYCPVLQLPLLPRLLRRARGRRRAILVPTAERDETIGLSMFQPLFRSVRAIMYNSPEERAMIHAVVGQRAVPGVVVGIGSDVPEQSAARRDSGRNTTSADRSRCTSAGSIRTRAARSCSSSSRAICRIPPASCRSC